LMKGHDALKFNTGKIAEGREADLLIWNLDAVNTFPVYDPLTSIIYSSDASNIRYTMVQGEFLKYDGILKADIRSIISKAGEIQKEILERGKGKSKVSY